MATTYNRYGLTLYPAQYDHLYTKVKDANNNVTYVDETGATLSNNTSNGATYLTQWENKNDLVKAEHVTILQDMLFSLQRTIGLNPYIPSKTFKDPTDATKTLDSSQISTIDGRLDYIEKAIPDNNAITSVVNSHVHGKNGLKAVSLTTNSGEVNGLLGSSNISLSIADANSINGNNIYSASGVTINNALDLKYGKSGGDITGNVNITGTLTVGKSTKSRNIFEAEANELTAGTNTTRSAKTGSNSDQTICNKPKSGTAETDLATISASSLRYGRYTACIRMYFKIDNGAVMPSTSDILFNVYVGTTAKGAQKVVRFTGKQINDQTYFNDRCRTFYVTFDYSSAPGDIQDPTIKITYNQSTPYQIACDGIVVVPAHTAIL